MKIKDNLTNYGFYKFAKLFHTIMPEYHWKFERGSRLLQNFIYYDNKDMNGRQWESIFPYCIIPANRQYLVWRKSK